MTRLLPLLALAACVQPRPEPVPDVAKKVALEAKRVDRLAWEVEKAREIRAAENEVLMARTRKDRERAMRMLVMARRTP